MNFDYNVLQSGIIRLLTATATSSDVTISNCAFAVNVTAAVSHSFIYHSEGSVVIEQSSSTSVLLSLQSLISFVDFLFFFCLFFCCAI